MKVVPTSTGESDARYPSTSLSHSIPITATATQLSSSLEPPHFLARSWDYLSVTKPGHVIFHFNPLVDYNPSTSFDDSRYPSHRTFTLLFSPSLSSTRPLCQDNPNLYEGTATLWRNYWSSDRVHWRSSFHQASVL